LRECRKYGIIPKHLDEKLNNFQKCFSSEYTKGEFNKIKNNFLRKILNLEITIASADIRSSNKTKNWLEEQIKNELNFEENRKFNEKQIQRYKHFKKETSDRHTTKINKLKMKTLSKLGFIENDKMFVNRTNVVFPNECVWLLSRGKKFSLPNTKKNFSAIHTIAELEILIQRKGEEVDKEMLRNKVANRIENYQRSLSNNNEEKFITAVFEKTEKFIKKQKDIMIVNADKGNITVVMYRKDYKEKMEKLLEDKATYKKIRKDPTDILQKKNNNLVADMFKKKYISFKEKIELTCPAGIAPRIYGLPKVHKEGTPLRPIVASTDVPCRKLSTYLVQILKTLVCEDLNIKNAFEFREDMKGMVIEETQMMVSFDVVSLFTNIPIYLAIKSIMMKWDVIKETTKIPKNIFLKILKFCLSENNYFSYDGDIYNQVYGLPMGNPLSPIIANIVMDVIIKTTMEDLEKKDIKFRYITKYVDDIFAIIEGSQCEEILEELNKQHKRIKFTKEEQNEGKLAFLDCIVHRKENFLEVNWYRKEIASGRMINYRSNQPESMKINTARNFVKKVLLLSDESFHKDNIQVIENTLEMNNFPKTLIKRLIEEVKRTGENERGNNTQATRQENVFEETETANKKKFCTFTYNKKLLENRGLLHSLIDEDTRVAYKSATTIRKLFTNNKDKVDIAQQNNIVYQVKCNGSERDRCNLSYIGTSKRNLKTRMKEHEDDIRKKRTNSTALCEHAITKEHTIDFENVSIIDKEKNERKRYILESLHIQQKRKECMNLKTDVGEGSKFYLLALERKNRLKNYV